MYQEKKKKKAHAVLDSMSFFEKTTRKVFHLVPLKVDLLDELGVQLKQ